MVTEISHKTWLAYGTNVASLNRILNFPGLTTLGERAPRCPEATRAAIETIDDALQHLQQPDLRASW